MPRELPTGVYFVLFIVLVVGNILMYRAIFAPPILKVTVLEVGKGNAVLLQTSEKTVLVDTGPDASVLRALGTALPVWQRRIDLVILTSTKSSSTGGLTDVKHRYRVRTLITIGEMTTPYGTRLTLDGTSIDIISAGLFTISYGSNTFSFSSSTPKGVYYFDKNETGPSL